MVVKQRAIGRWIVVATLLPVVGLPACATALGSPTPSPDQTAAHTIHGGCADLPVKEALTAWAGSTGGVVRARVRLTGRQTTTDDHGLLTAYSELAIIDPQVVAGHDPHVRTGWVEGGKNADGTPQPTRGPEGALWGPDGAAVIVIDPARSLEGTHDDKVPLIIAPVVGKNIVFSGAGCWGFKDLPTNRPFSGDLSEVPGSETADAMRPAMGTCPYSDFVSLAKRVLRSR